MDPYGPTLSRVDEDLLSFYSLFLCYMFGLGCYALRTREISHRLLSVSLFYYSSSLPYGLPF